MDPANLIAVAVILVILGAATAYLIHAKRSGKKCVGCPYCESCGSKGGKSSCGGDQGKHKK